MTAVDNIHFVLACICYEVRMALVEPTDQCAVICCVEVAVCEVERTGAEFDFVFSE